MSNSNFLSPWLLFLFVVTFFSVIRTVSGFPHEYILLSREQSHTLHMSIFYCRENSLRLYTWAFFTVARTVSGFLHESLNCSCDRKKGSFKKKPLSRWKEIIITWTVYVFVLNRNTWNVDSLLLLGQHDILVALTGSVPSSWQCLDC